MARTPRLEAPGIPLHIIQRGVDRQPCFIRDWDYIRYLHELSECAEQHGCEIHAYVLMTNHVHLLATTHLQGSRQPDDAAAWTTLRGVLQSLPHAHGHIVGGQVQVVPDRYRRIPSWMSALHRAQSGPGGNGGVPRLVPLVQLSLQCAWPTRSTGPFAFRVLGPVARSHAALRHLS
ncbi:transposase [Arenimonas daejeonensis]|uniref:transposase n=1 Tax=Arenimonas daejeonensis TaxID=370777 RepID=UPI001D15050F|nr:transposase [Arenimonas daejeonensis]